MSTKSEEHRDRCVELRRRWVRKQLPLLAGDDLPTDQRQRVLDAVHDDPELESDYRQWRDLIDILHEANVAEVESYEIASETPPDEQELGSGGSLWPALAARIAAHREERAEVSGPPTVSSRSSSSSRKKRQTRTQIVLLGLAAAASLLLIARILSRSQSEEANLAQVVDASETSMPAPSDTLGTQRTRTTDPAIHTIRDPRDRSGVADEVITSSALDGPSEPMIDRSSILASEQRGRVSTPHDLYDGRPPAVGDPFQVASY